MSVYQKFQDCKAASPFFMPLYDFTLAPGCFVSAWVLDLLKKGLIYRRKSSISQVDNSSS